MTLDLPSLLESSINARGQRVPVASYKVTERQVHRRITAPGCLNSHVDAQRRYRWPDRIHEGIHGRGVMILEFCGCQQMKERRTFAVSIETAFRSPL